MSNMSQYQEFIAKSRYCRWMEDKGRRESFDEAVDRYFDFFKEHLNEKFNYSIPEDEEKSYRESFKSLDFVGSMRALMTAGPALKRDAAAGYNCSYLAVNKIRSFDEMIYILMCGTGVGFSVERQFINDLPAVPDELYESDSMIVVRDSKIGWAKCVKEVVGMLYSGTIPKVDYSKLRPAGAKLKTFGGRSSGPDPLKDLIDFTIRSFKAAKGRKLTSVEVHDIMCYVASTVVVGGVRRSALISLSNLSDDRMRNAKSGQWWVTNPQRALANNSVAYTEKPDMQTFMKEWVSLHESKSGERGIFNRQAAKKQVERSNALRRKWFGDDVRLREVNHEFGCNP